MHKDITGLQIGYLTAESYLGADRHGHSIWRWRCKCGNTIDIRPNDIRKRSDKSCGCSRKEFRKSRRKTDCVTSVMNHRYRNMLRRHYKHNDESVVPITFEQWRDIVTKPCAYCGEEPSQPLINYYTGETVCYVNGVDRVDSSVGYIASNVVPCCVHCNTAKHTLSLAEFFDLIKRIYHFNNLGDNN